MNFDYDALWSYDNFRFAQLHVREEGVYKIGHSYYILCPDITAETLARDNTLLEKWFSHNKSVLCDVRLVSSLPEGAEIVKELAPVQRASSAGVPRTIGQLYCDLALELPPDFPDFALHNPERNLVIVTGKELSSADKNRLKDSYERMKLPIPYQLAVDPNLTMGASHTRSQGDIDLLPARKAKAMGFSKELQHLMREDEEYWLEMRGKYHNTNKIALPKGFGHQESRCLINASTSAPKDIRNYLSLYQKVAIVVPLDPYANEFFAGAGLSEAELVELAALARVEFILPQPIDRYPVRLLERLAEVAPHAMLFSRRLALATALDCRKRNPLLYVNMPHKERSQVLRSLLVEVRKLSDLRKRAICEDFLFELGRIWCHSEEMLHRRGAMGNSALGMAFPVSKLIAAISGRELGLELSSAAMSVEWGGAIRSMVSPVEDHGYSDRRAMELIATIYSAMPSGMGMAVPAPNVNVDDVLAIGKHIPVVEFAKSFSGADIERFRSLMHNLSSHRYDAAEMGKAVQSFNSAVKQYESGVERLEKWNIAGTLVLNAAGLAANPKVSAAVATVSFGTWTIAVLRKLVNDGVLSNPEIRAWIDSAEGELLGVPPDAVLVSRIKNQLRKKL